MLSYSDALALVLDHAAPAAAAEWPLGEAIGCVLAGDLHAKTASPSFDNAAMDGYAIRSVDTAGASAEKPAHLTVSRTLAAGDPGTNVALSAGEAARIMTGAPVPPGAVSVIPVEMTQQDGETVLISAAYPAGRNIRLKGSDFAVGDLLLASGTLITSSAIPLLAASGHERFRVRPRPGVWWISTGRELVDEPGRQLLPGQIYNSSGPYGETALKAAGCDCLGRTTVGDDGESFRRALDAALASPVNVIISTGAVSVGTYDFVRAELEAMGAEILLHRARVKPGKPILFAKLPDGRHFFGLPGNPVSTAMGLRMFAIPFLRALAGLPAEQPVKARLSDAVSATKGFTVFLKAGLFEDNGKLMVTPFNGQESYKLHSMALMNAWIVHPEGIETLNGDEMVNCFPADRSLFA
ncbi:molybdopterin molybdotransferase MoeA [Gimibacter soli]|uniref:Molybdopterin molybdenumtransferase n=1 Tax=Gimibacter soli TaxID=3024400 RepID=A0AAE9XSP8_9PROT|nr:gephyrin-like molybdotransferase Glp [Gimibacter soli]WCL55564.1 molybdopterin molybdotransferase MoeA [Gimibacter soli]